MGTAPRLKKDPVLPTLRRLRAGPGTGPAVGPCRGPGGSVRPVMGMGGAGGPDAERRRRLVALVIVFALVLAAGATVLSLVLG